MAASYHLVYMSLHFSEIGQLSKTIIFHIHAIVDEADGNSISSVILDKIPMIIFKEHFKNEEPGNSHTVSIIFGSYNLHLICKNILFESHKIIFVNQANVRLSLKYRH